MFEASAACIYNLHTSAKQAKPICILFVNKRGYYISIVEVPALTTILILRLSSYTRIYIKIPRLRYVAIGLPNVGKYEMFFNH